MTSFRARPLDLATEADFGALRRLPRQDSAYIKPHLLASTPLFLARCPRWVPVVDNKFTPQFNNEVQHLGPAESGGYPKSYEINLQASVVSRT